MSRSRQAIISDFLQGKSNTNYNSLTSDGKELFSYSTKIAYFDDADGLVIRMFKYSVTTSRQLSELVSQCQRKGIAYKTSEPMGRYWYLHNIQWSQPK